MSDYQELAAKYLKALAQHDMKAWRQRAAFNENAEPREPF